MQFNCSSSRESPALENSMETVETTNDIKEDPDDTVEHEEKDSEEFVEGELEEAAKDSPQRFVFPRCLIIALLKCPPFWSAHSAMRTFFFCERAGYLHRHLSSILRGKNAVQEMPFTE